MREDLRCYGSPQQRELLKVVAGAPLFRDFFLTGGTCLSVFYLHHRVSHDLDFFTTGDLNLAGMAPAIRALLRPDAILATAKHFFSCVVAGIKVDFVMDPLSSRRERHSVLVDEVAVKVDDLDNIGPNKLCALISRGAPKDAIDCFVLYRESRDRFMRDYHIARSREALLDDLMYAGEKLRVIAEEAPGILRAIGPDLMIAVHEQELAGFYTAAGETLFQLGIREGHSPA